jgi:uncharacterized protein involved in outer membrane biogenesis
MALEYYGPDVLGAPVKVMHVGISPKTGEGSLKELEIGTPRGFSAPRTIFVEGMKVSVDPATLMEKRVVIREIIVEQPYITYERGPAGTNLDAIQKNIEAYVKTTSTEGGDPKVARAHEDKRRFIVERISIRGAKVTMTAPGLKGQGVTFDLPEVQMRDVGKKQDGLRASEIANLVVRELISKIAQRVLTSIDLIRKGGASGALDALKGILK